MIRKHIFTYNFSSAFSTRPPVTYIRWLIVACKILQQQSKNNTFLSDKWICITGNRHLWFPQPILLLKLPTTITLCGLLGRNWSLQGLDIWFYYIKYENMIWFDREISYWFCSLLVYLVFVMNKNTHEGKEHIEHSFQGFPFSK